MRICCHEWTPSSIWPITIFDELRWAIVTREWRLLGALNLDRRNAMSLRFEKAQSMRGCEGKGKSFGGKSDNDSGSSEEIVNKCLKTCFGRNEFRLKWVRVQIEMIWIFHWRVNHMTIIPYGQSEVECATDPLKKALLPKFNWNPTVSLVNTVWFPGEYHFTTMPKILTKDNGLQMVSGGCAGKTFSVS